MGSALWGQKNGNGPENICRPVFFFVATSLWSGLADGVFSYE